jgi:N-acyl-D-aspartate/D-glutamate deacylase
MTYGLTLRMGRERGVPLMFTLAALHMGDAGLEAMKDRGRVQVGKIADLTLFDPKTVTDNATYKAGENGLPSTGVPYVIVHGTIVVENSRRRASRCATRLKRKAASSRSTSASRSTNARSCRSLMRRCPTTAAPASN